MTVAEGLGVTAMWLLGWGQTKRWAGVREDDEHGDLGAVAGGGGGSHRTAYRVTWARGGVLKRAERAMNPCSKVGERDEEVTSEREESLTCPQQEADG